jgi:hypothetical protein
VGWITRLSMWLNSWATITVLDFNDDWVEDLIIGASADDAPGTDASSVYFKLYK